MKCCPFCHEQLTADITSSVSLDTSYSCGGKDHRYIEHHGGDEGDWQELVFNNTTYYGNDIYKICKLKAFS